MTSLSLHSAKARHRVSPLKQYGRWLQISRQRRHLSRLPDAALKDLGLTRLEANAEARRWFWDDAPNAR